MITDEEYSEVAEGLRYQVKKLGPNMDAHEFANYVADVIDPDNELRYDQMTLLLADLIDRPTCTIVCESDAYGTWGDRIDGLHFYELSCGHIPAGFEKPEYCPKCGAVITDAKR